MTTHGGARTGAGAKKNPNRMVRTTINLTPELESKLLTQFDGHNWSEFMRNILELGLKEYKARNVQNTGNTKTEN